MSYGLIYMISGIIASAAVSNDRVLTKVLIILFSTIWGMFCGLLAGIVVFAIVAAIYSSFPVPMQVWEAAVWGVGLCVLMQFVAVVRRFYVYV